MLSRMLGAALLRAETYEDVESDRGATIQALLVVIAVAVASGVGGLLAGDADVVRGVVFGVIRGVVTWAIWALATWLVGAKLLKTLETEADWGQLARTTGFAQTPGLLSILVFIPVVGVLIALVAFFWAFVAMVIAIRQALDYTSTWRAFFVILIAFIPVIIINAIIFTVLGVWDQSPN